METMQPTLRIGRNVWDHINMPEGEFRRRVQKIRREMKKDGIDVLLIYSNAFNEYATTCYISNYLIRLPRGTLIVLPQKGEITLLFEGASRGLPFAKTTTWVKNIIACGDVSKECSKYLKEKQVVPSTVGTVGLRQFMPYYQFKLLAEALSQSTIVDADHIIQDMRTVKSGREHDQIRRSCRIVKHVFDLVTSTRFPRMDERLLEAMIYREARLEGAGDVRVLIAKPQEVPWALRPAEDALIMSGQSVIIYLALDFERYWSEGIRTFVVKDSSFTEADGETVKALCERIMSGMKPGRRLSEIYTAAMREIQKSNVEYISEYGMGGGIGLSLGELPVISEGESRQLKAGMCLTLRLAAKDAAMGAVMVGNTLCVSKHAVEVLTV